MLANILVSSSCLQTRGWLPNAMGVIVAGVASDEVIVNGSANPTDFQAGVDLETARAHFDSGPERFPEAQPHLFLRVGPGNRRFRGVEAAASLPNTNGKWLGAKPPTISRVSLGGTPQFRPHKSTMPGADS
jgi:hypothetical protein